MPSVDRFGQSAPSSDELKQIISEAGSSNSQKNLRNYFERIQELRRIHSGNFDLQLLVAEAQEIVIQRARELQSRPPSANEQEDLFAAAVAEPRPDQVHGKTSVGNKNRRALRSLEANAAGTALPAYEDNPFQAASPPITDVNELNNRSWRRATILALVLTAVICVIFFYLIQAARKINLTPPAKEVVASKATDSSKVTAQDVKRTEAGVVATSPTVRLYTDLVPGTVSVDDGELQDLKDGELVLDHLEAGRHSIKVAGRSGLAAFSFDVSDNSAPQAVAPVTATNAMAVVVSTQDGKGRLTTNLAQGGVSLDGNTVGSASPDGLALENLGTTDHELEITDGKSKQRFVMTYTAAPVLTVYVKSDPNAGTVTIDAKQDGVSVFIDDKAYRHKTDQGQLRIPLKVGQYVIHIHKDGFTDPPPQSVDVKKGEEAELSFHLEALPSVAALQIRGGTSGSAVYIDNQQNGAIGDDGSALISNIKSGEHTIELRLEGWAPKKLQRQFSAGSTVALSGADVTLDKIVSEARQAPPSPVVIDKPAIASNAFAIPGEQVRKGGGFVHYNVPKSAGRYSFEAHSKIGGFLKHEKLQWYAGYQNSENYVMFSVDGKHASVHEMVDGKSAEVARIPFNASSGEWVEVELSVEPGVINARVKSSENGWSNLGAVSSHGRDFTQDKVGIYVPGNDEVAVANFHFTNH